jgi:hypothetical protein
MAVNSVLDYDAILVEIHFYKRGTELSKCTIFIHKYFPFLGYSFPNLFYIKVIQLAYLFRTELKWNFQKDRLVYRINLHEDKYFNKSIAHTQLSLIQLVVPVVTFILRFLDFYLLVVSFNLYLKLCY